MGDLLAHINHRSWKKLSKRLSKLKHYEVNMSSLKTVCDSHEDEYAERFPIHLACLYGIGPSGMAAILNFFREAASQIDDEGSTPLHYLLHYHHDEVNLNVLEMLLEAYPEAVNIQDNYGCTPLFHAVEHGIGVKIEHLALLLQSMAGVEALTKHYYLSHLRRPRKKKPIMKFKPNKSFYPETGRQDNVAYRRTPLYMMWDVAINALDTVRFSVRPKNKNTREKRIIGKRLEKAQMMLECVYLGKPINPSRFKARFIHIKGYDSRNVPLLRRIKGSFMSKRQGLQSNLETASASLSDVTYPLSSLRRSLKNSRQTQSTSSFQLWNKKRSARGNLDAIPERGSMRSLSSHDDDVVRQELRKQMKEIGKLRRFVDLTNIQKGENKFRVLHAVLKLHTYLPESAFDYAISNYPGQVYETEEETGNYPLHIVANMHSEIDLDRDVILAELLELHKAAAQRKNIDGLLPLHIALSNSDPFDFTSLQLLLESNQAAVGILDDRSKLYPFELAASNNYELSAVYLFLREAPFCLEAARQRETFEE